MQVGGWAVNVLVQGYPGKAVCHGGLGWSSIVLLRGHGRVALVDAGSFNIRGPLIEHLARHGLVPADVTDLLLTHSHWDHSVNWPLFRHARIAIGGVELDWSLGEPWGETPVPELYVRELAAWPTLRRVAEGEDVLPGVSAHAVPGHTPGCLLFRLAGEAFDVLFAGDAAKNRAELVSGTTDMTYDPAVSAASLALIWRLWRERAGSVVIPGHDLPMVLEGGVPRYLGEREAAVLAWFGDDLEQTTLVSLVA